MTQGAQRELDAATLAAWLREHRPAKAVIEHAAARPGQGVSSMFRYGSMFWGAHGGARRLGGALCRGHGDEVEAGGRDCARSRQGALAPDCAEALAGSASDP
jgi:hypothetical protein